MKLLSKFPFSVWKHIGKGGKNPNALYHRKEGWFFCFLTKYCRLSSTVASQKSKTQTSTLQQSFSTYLKPLCWSMHVVIMLGSFSCSSSLYSILIHFWTFSIIAWINCMNKVSILCLNLSQLPCCSVSTMLFSCRHKVKLFSLIWNIYEKASV